MFDATESTLILQRGGGELTARLLLFDRKGAIQTDYNLSRALFGPRVSPDQQQVAMVIQDQDSASQNIWILDRGRRTLSHVTFGSRDVAPVWSPDGKWIAYAAADRGPTRKLVLKPTDGSAGERDVLRGNDTVAQPSSWSSDGRLLFVTRHVPLSPENEIWVVSLSDGAARRLIGGRGFNHPQLSPDGRWLAYIADANGAVDVYLTHYPDLRGRWQVSNGEGRFPRWSKDGKELYYVGGEMLTAMRIDGSAEAPRFSNPEPLFRVSLASNAYPYAPTSDGNFIVAVPVFDESQEPLTVITNWKAKLGLQ
jgi:TolB protein